MKESTKPKIKSFTDLNVWQEGHKLVIEVYKLTKTLPQDQMFSLADQLQRAAVSVTSNIAEGFGRQSQKDQTHFLYIAAGSLKEVQNQLLICRDLNYIQQDKFKLLANQTVIVSKLLHGFIKTSKTRQVKQQTTAD